jgi:biopolymer transport protein ExbD
MGSGGNEINADPNLTPLLDVVLQLIMFFMITVNFVATEQLPADIKLPVAQSLVPRDKKKDKDKDEPKEIVDERIYININKKGEIVGLSELTAANPTRENLRLYFVGRMEPNIRKAKLEKREKPKVILVLRADKEVRYSKIFDVIEASRLAGIEHYQMRGISQYEKK